MNLRWSLRERVLHVVMTFGNAVVASAILPALSLRTSFDEARKPLRPRPGHHDECGVTYRGCHPDCPASAWDKAYDEENEV
jgi:hypothetical protein